ncbi:hypothetical protein THOM_2365 [Trachipleistophora hominis]|uniref:Uncharacterized protein n=1 Tax=Trachipleistophora hominis TaxID=72359 RepID=L7JUK7_TRAHO|nr:hypothetical protein THOM_2365 [Trachipleistophora hominis]
MNLFLLLFPLAMALELRTLVYQDKLRIYPAKKRGGKILPDFEQHRNVGLGVRQKKFVLQVESHLTVNDFWRLLGQKDDELAKKSHALQLNDKGLYMSLFKSPVDNVTLFSVILASLRLPENSHVNLVVDDTEVKKIAKDATQAFANVKLKLKYILPKTVVLALDGYVKGMIEKKYVLVINTSGEKGIFCLYTTDKVEETAKNGESKDEEKGKDEKEKKADNEPKEDKKKVINDGYALKLVFAHETDIISDITIRKIMYEFIRDSVEKAYNKFRTEERNLEPVEVGYYPFDDGKNKLEYYFLIEEIVDEMIQLVQKRAPVYVRIEIIIYNSLGKQIGVLTSQEFNLLDLYKQLDEYCDKNRSAVVAFEENLVNSVLKALDDKEVTADNLLQHIDVICHGVSMQLNLVKQFFKTIKIKNREFVTYYGSSGNYYQQYKIKDKRVYKVKNTPIISSKKYEDIMHELELYERSKDILGKCDKIEYDHPIVNTYKELWERIKRDDQELTVDNYKDFVRNYSRMAKEYEPEKLKMARTELRKQLKEVEALKKKEPEIYKAVKTTYDDVNDWFKEHGEKVETTYSNINDRKLDLMYTISAVRQDITIREMNKAKEKERLEAKKKAEEAALAKKKAEKTAVPIEEQESGYFTKNLLLTDANGFGFFKNLFGKQVDAKNLPQIQERKEFGESFDETKYEMNIPRLTGYSLSDEKDVLLPHDTSIMDMDDNMEEFMKFLRNSGPLMSKMDDTTHDYEKLLKGNAGETSKVEC